MHWDLDILERTLELYKEQRVLWDNKHQNYNDKDIRDHAFKLIATTLNMPNITATDIARKIRTMKAAYQVEMRNINTAKIRGFFYNPTLNWFPVYKNFMTEIEKLKREDEGDDYSLEEGSPNTYVLKLGSRKYSTKDKKSKQPLYFEPSEETPYEDIFSDDSDDEFQTFGDHIAEQLRNIPTHRAVLIQNQINRIFARDKKLHKMHEDQFP